MKTTIARTARQLAAAVLIPILAAACQAETPTDAAGNEINPDGTVTITHLLVGIDGADPAATRAGENIPLTPLKGGRLRSSSPLNPPLRGVPEGQGMYGGARRAGDVPSNPAPLKTTFAEGDVLHIAVIFTQADARNSNYKLSTATRSADGRWTLAPALRLPQNPGDTYSIEIFYDGNRTEYNRFIGNTAATDFYQPGNFSRAYTETNYHANNGSSWPEGDPATATALRDGYENAYVRDALHCLGGTAYGSKPDPTAYGTLAITSRGVLTIGTVHTNALVRISSIVNQLGSPVQRAEVLTVNRYGTPGVPAVFTLFAPDGNDNGTRQALIGTASGNYRPTAIRITLEDKRVLTLTLPNAPTNGKGFLPEINRVYAYRLTLLPGAFSAVMDNDNVAWTPKADPIVPAGYTPIRTRADLEAIGAPGAPGLYPGMKGNYILMNDIDLTPANPAAPTAAELWTPLGYRADLSGDEAEGSIVRFTGRFNGNGHTLRGLTISSTKKQLGLFARLHEGAIVYNLHFSHASITGTNDDVAYGFGTLAGEATGSTIQQCSATDCTVAYTGNAAINYSPILGGLVGRAGGITDGTATTTLIYCHATRCTVSGGNAIYAGGLVGRNMGHTRLVASYTRSCTVSAQKYAGGLVGYNNGYLNLLYGCYAATASATITGSAIDKAAGALVGSNNNHGGDANPGYTNLIASCYATAAAATAANKLVGTNSGSAGANARILACVSPLAYKVAAAATPEEKNREGIVSIYPRGGSTGYRPVNDQLAFTHLGSEGLANLDLAFRNANGNPAADITPDVIPSGCALTLRLPIVQVTAPGSIQLGATPTDWRIGNVWSYMDGGNQSIPPTITWNK